MKVILLNKDYGYINAITVRRALKLMAKEKVTVEKYSSEVVRTVAVDIAIPLVLRLVYRVRQIYRRAVAWSRKNVMIRDRHTCVYCGTRSNLNIDHVLPRSRGGGNTFENTVTSCVTCNCKKGNRTPAEAGMAFRKRGYNPWQPTVMEFLSRSLDGAGVYELLTAS